MVLELHIWGPAFDLPSIDAQCLATIFYFRNCVPNDAWVLVPSSDPRISPLGELPALRDGPVWIASFKNIVAYLSRHSQDWDLDSLLDESQRAHCAAFSSFIISRGQPLLDLSLYVSSDNYFNNTRHALGTILSWPNSWTVPHQLRDRAKKRAEHLGLSGLDVDTAQEEDDQNTGLAAHIPKSLRKPKQTVSSLLGKNAQKNRFRVDAVTADFLEPLSDMLESKKWFLGDELSSADCLAIGYLALMQIDGLQQSWLKDALEHKYPSLGRWTRTQCQQTFGRTGGDDTTAAAAAAGLPWQAPPARSVTQVVQAVVENCIGSIPMLGSICSVADVGNLSRGEGNVAGKKQQRLARLQRQREIYVQALASTIAMTGLVGWLLYQGYLQLPRRAMKPQRRQFGEAGALLGLI